MTFDTAKAKDSPLARFSWRRAAVAWADESGPLIRTALKNAAPVGKGPRAGRLRDAIRYERATGEGSVTLKFSTYVPYAPYVLGGTKPHVISAQAARALHWQRPDGSDIFRRKVSHPGTKPNPFPEKVIPVLAPLLRERLEAAVREAMEGL
jgi:hypothetical protein